MMAWRMSSPARPNGSRLSCGASAGGRKRPVLRHVPAGAQTYASPESRPRQLQALVRQQGHCCPIRHGEIHVGFDA